MHQYDYCTLLKETCPSTDVYLCITDFKNFSRNHYVLQCSDSWAREYFVLGIFYFIRNTTLSKSIGEFYLSTTVTLDHEELVVIKLISVDRKLEVNQNSLNEYKDDYR